MYVCVGEWVVVETYLSTQKRAFLKGVGAFRRFSRVGLGSLKGGGAVLGRVWRNGGFPRGGGGRV